MNRGEIRARAYYRLGIAAGDTDDDDNANAEISEHYRELVSELGTNIAQADLAFTADQAEVTLPSDLLRTLTITRAGVRGPMMRITPEEWAAGEASRMVQPVTEIGPYAFVENGLKSILVEPPPQETEAQGAVIRYVAEPTALTDDAHIPTSLPEAWHRILVERVVASIAYSEEEQGLAQAAELRADVLESKIKRDIERRPGGSRTGRPRALPPPRIEI